jgi:hypothetical protein
VTGVVFGIDGYSTIELPKESSERYADLREKNFVMVRHSSSISLRLQAQLLRRADQLVDTLGLLRGPSRPGRVMELARRRSGLDDFGEWSFAEPLAVLLRAYDKEANLSAFGWVAARWDMVRYLSDLLRLRDEEKKHPDILDEPIKQPIFILGLPRSGTTFLHNVLGEDPANSVPRCWQTIYPRPEPHPDTGSAGSSAA